MRAPFFDAYAAIVVGFDVNKGDFTGIWRALREIGR